MLELDEHSVNYVQPIVDLMSEGKYEEARALLNAVPKEWRMAVSWTVAAQTNTLL